MTTFQALTWLASLNLGAAFAYAALRMTRAFGGAGLSCAAELRAHYWILALLAAACVAQPAIHPRTGVAPMAQAWSARPAGEFDRTIVARDETLEFRAGSATATIDARDWSLAAGWLLAAFASWSAFVLARDCRRLGKLKREAALVRQIGRVRVFVSPDASSAFAHRGWRRADVVIPAQLLEDGASYRAAILHELQHHRQRDTLFVYPLWALGAACAFNPLAKLWIRWISDLQEFACDEALIGHKKVAPRAYAQSLVEAARIAMNFEREPVCATGLSFGRRRKTLSRRIERMMTQSNGARLRRFPLAGVALAAALIAGSAYASGTLAQDRRISTADARRMAEIARAKSSFPISVNDLVVNELNLMLGTPDGRARTRAALVRLETYRSMVTSKIAEYGAPEELMAIPIIESGYKNRPPASAASDGAALWGFISTTARRYGLRVDANVDERLDATAETDAAMRYLISNNLGFRDWRLAITAYNVGENAVEAAIEKSGSRDAWTLIRGGLENDRAYLAKVMAAILIMRDPDSAK